MNSLILAGIGIIFLSMGYIFYSRLIARLWDINPENSTPAHTNYDGMDFVPARHWTILFGHHFASIAGAGPIIGPVLVAALWGWLPAMLWILLGTVFIGAVHDFSALMASVRSGGKSISEVTRQTLGRPVQIVFALFLWLSLVLVVAVFAAVTAKTLISEPRVVIPTFGLIFNAVLVGIMMYKFKIHQVWATFLGLVILAGLLYLGYIYPVSLGGENQLTVWIFILLGYAYLASVIPVNILLQPRDYLSTFILFFGLAAGYIGLVLSRAPVNTPAFISFNSAKGPLWPMLFVFIACGAVSGFHALIASGTTAKQLDNEKNARKIGYGAMVLEGALALLALLVVTAGLYWKGAPQDPGLIYPELLKSGDWIGTFARGYGRIVAPLMGSTFGVILATIMLNSFVMTTLDSATRITRYVTEEILATGLKIKFFYNRFISTLLVVSVSLYLALGAWQEIWPIFGASNQILAALVLIVISVYLIEKGKNSLYTFIPAIFMLLTMGAAIIQLIVSFSKSGRTLLMSIGILILSLTIFIVVRSIRQIFVRR